jgi:hypothetical protein
MKRVVRLADLTPEERRLVLALIAAGEAAQSQRPLPSPGKGAGAAPSKEHGT